MLAFRLNSLENLVKEQNTHIQKLNHELKQQNRNVQTVFVKELEVAMSKSQMQMAKLFENCISLQKSRERELQDSFLNGVSQIFNKQVIEKLHGVVIQEIKQVILPGVLAVFESLKHQLDIQYSQKLNTTDHLLKDNIAKLVNSKVSN